MNKIQVVVGSLLGDEGKGLMVDYYASQNPDAVVVRYNSSAQAGHTVTTPDGERHIFSHFSSGSFNGNVTYLSQYFVLNPMLFRKEHEEFVEKFGFKPEIRVHGFCPLTTPFDMLINQQVERSRGYTGQRHGSCGIGFGETLERIKQGYAVAMRGMLLRHPPKQQRNTITYMMKEWYDNYFSKIIDINKCGNIKYDNILEHYINDVLYLSENITLSSYRCLKDKDLIFEGAQGLLLDQNYGYFPHVTRSNTGMYNVSKIIEVFEPFDVTVNYVTRSYITRHGAGPLQNEDPLLEYDICDGTNFVNAWQGDLRTAPFDFDLFNMITSKDFALHAPVGAKKETTMTCMDQIPYDDIMKWRECNDWREAGGELFENRVKQSFNYLSYGPTREDILKNDIKIT